MATKQLTSLKGRVIRLTRLDACGVPVTGACSSIVSEGFISVQISPEEEAGEEFTQKNAWGTFCVNEKDLDQTKWVNVEIELCKVNPDILDLVAGANSLTNGDDTIGSTFGPQNNTGAFAIEVWTKQAGTDCSGGSPEWGYFVVPFCINGKVSDVGAIENGVMNLTVMGEGQPSVAEWNSLFGVAAAYGAVNPLLDAGGMPVGDFWGVVKTTVQPPTETDGCVAIA